MVLLPSLGSCALNHHPVPRTTTKRRNHPPQAVCPILAIFAINLVFFTIKHVSHYPLPDHPPLSTAIQRLTIQSSWVKFTDPSHEPVRSSRRYVKSQQWRMELRGGDRRLIIYSALRSRSRRRRSSPRDEQVSGLLCRSSRA